ncbi:MAG: LytTR family DNA-binding domain-containing protein [Oceanicaulis sp.]
MSRLAEQARQFSRRRPGVVAVAAGGVLAFCAYLAVFQLTRSGQALWLNISSGVINAAPAALLAGVVIAVIRARVVERAPPIQIGAHAGLAIVFCYAWYLAVIILNGMRGGSLSEGFRVNPFVSVALTWQLFQGLAIYAVAALGAYVLHYRELLGRLRAQAEPAPARPVSPRKVMVRGADGLISLDLDEVLYVRAAGDGAVIVTRTNTHETRKTLTALAQMFADGDFLRAHRSVLVNRDAILSAEPAGDGRLTLHLPAGQSVTTSRAGARAVRAAAL